MNKVSLRLVRETSHDYIKCSSTRSIVNALIKLEDIENLPQESMFVVCLDTKNHITNYSMISKGTVDSCLCEPASIFKMVLLSNASKFVLVHNHPSGDSTPSKQDIEITDRLMQASNIMGIHFVDHIVIAQDEFTSVFSK